MNKIITDMAEHLIYMPSTILRALRISIHHNNHIKWELLLLSFLWMRKPEPKEVKQLARSHVTKWW